MMSPLRSILVVSPNYPYKGESVFPFVKNLCEEFVRQGHEVTVLCPQSVTSSLLHRKGQRPKEWTDDVAGKTIRVYQPRYITAPFKYHDINNFSLRICLSLFFLTHKIEQDAVYSHFWSSAYAVLPFAKRAKKPLFVASGESDIRELFSTRFSLKNLCDYVRGVVCVSSKNKDESIELGLTTAQKCEVFPNAVNADSFYKRDKAECRKELGLPQNAFLIAFVGWFIERKGPLRVAEAINKVGGVNSLFIGKGEQEPKCDGILFKGALPHEEVPLYLGAADAFVLPTQHEGCCNAVVEAMACGLPIISSNLPFNWDVLDDCNSIMVDPNNVDEIADAIKRLRDNVKLRDRLSAGATKKAASLTIDQRAKSIIEFMESRK